MSEPYTHRSLVRELAEMRRMRDSFRKRLMEREVEVEQWKAAFEDAHDEAEDFGRRLNRSDRVRRETATSLRSIADGRADLLALAKRLDGLSDLPRDNDHPISHWVIRAKQAEAELDEAKERSR